jgi:hypothetical protein
MAHFSECSTDNIGLHLKNVFDEVSKKVASNVTGVGGIDFNAVKMNLSVQNSACEIKFNLDPAMLQELQNVPGFTPIITKIQQAGDLEIFLGIKK